MECEAEQELMFTPPRVLLVQKPHASVRIKSPERSGTLTPPLYTSASVPFRWEEEPGKPRGCTTLVPKSIDFTQKCLELPPRLLMDTLPSPTTVLEGPYLGKSSRFQSSSFRIIRREWYGSFRRSCSPERGNLGAMVLSKIRVKERGVLSSWGWGGKAKREAAGGGSYVFPSSVDKEAESIKEEEEINGSKEAKVESMRRSGSFSAVSQVRSQFWTNIYEGLKQVVPWKSKKLKKGQGLVV